MYKRPMNNQILSDFLIMNLMNLLISSDCYTGTWK